MIYAIISDIHGNLEALLSVLDYIKSNYGNIDKIVCLGDIVGYGADPIECIKATRDISDVILAGNHDFAVCEMTSIDNFNDYAKKAVMWSRSVVGNDEMNFLKSLPFIYQEENVSFVHSSLHKPEYWRYLLRASDTYIDFEIMNNQILFVGHTHIPVIFEFDGKEIKILTSDEVSLHQNRKYIINPGSVGQPRDKDPRASFVFFDSDKKFVKRVRVEYDLEETQKKILDAGLPEVLATRLSYGG